MNLDDDSQEQQEEQEADQAHASRRKIDNFLILARGAQNARDKREQEEQRQIEGERKAWDETIEQIRRNQQENEQEFDR